MQTSTDLLTAATAAKQSGDLEKAVECLRNAYKLAERERDTSLSIDSYLRLPLYLQRAGKADEAWREFNLIVANRADYKIKTKLNAEAYWKIYDKMRLFLQREKRFIEAVRLGIQSYLFELLAMNDLIRDSIRMSEEHRQLFREYLDEEYDDDDLIEYQRERLKFLLSEECIRNKIEPLLKKAKLNAKQSALVDLLMTATDGFPNISPSKILKTVDAALR